MDARSGITQASWGVGGEQAFTIASPVSGLSTYAIVITSIYVVGNQYYPVIAELKFFGY